MDSQRALQASHEAQPSPAGRLPLPDPASAPVCAGAFTLCSRGVTGPQHILVVEASDEDFATVLGATRRAGVLQPVERARSGDEGLSLLRASLRAPGGVPALVLLGLRTPTDDGREALLAIKQDSRLRALPLVVLSTSRDPCELDFSYACGARAYHVKPARQDALPALLDNIFAHWLNPAMRPTQHSAG